MKDPKPQDAPGLEPVGEPIGWMRWKIMCSRCGKDAGYVPASDLFRDNGKPGEPRQNQISEPCYITFGSGRGIQAICVPCLTKIASTHLEGE